MPIYPVQCQSANCREIFEVILPMSQHGQWPPCQTCGGSTEQVYVPDGLNASHFSPVVVHRAKDGTFRFPAATDAPMPAGYERVELRTTADVRAFEHTVNAQEFGKIQRKIERDCQWIEHQESVNRRDLRSAMESMSPRGRAFAQLAMAIHNRQRPRLFEPGFHVDAFSNDLSNREAHTDARTQWRRRRE